jgi:hypothetical protein
MNNKSIYDILSDYSDEIETPWDNTIAILMFKEFKRLEII